MAASGKRACPNMQTSKGNVRPYSDNPTARSMANQLAMSLMELCEQVCPMLVERWQRDVPSGLWMRSGNSTVRRSHSAFGVLHF